MRLLGIDIGGTFIKSAVLDLAKQQLVDVRRSGFPQFRGTAVAGVREIDAAGVLRAVEELLRLYRASDSSLEGVAFSTQMHSLVLCTESGDLLAPATSWQDHRTIYDGSYRDLQNICTPEDLWEIGNELRSGHPVAILFSMARNAGLPFRKGYRITSLADWIAFQLTQVWQPMHVSQAGATGLWSVWRSIWSDSWCRLVRVRPEGLPEVTTTGRPSDSLVLGAPWKIWSPVGDQQAALLGVGFRSDDLSINVATGSQVSVQLPNPPASPSGGYTVRPFFNNSLLATITHPPAGRALDRWVETLTEVATQGGLALEECRALLHGAAVELESRALPRMDLSLFPCTTGESGSVTRINEENLSAAHLYRAAIRCMANNYKHAARQLPASSIKRLLASGGISQKNELLTQDVAELFGMTVTIADVTEDALHGLLKHTTDTLS